MLTCTKRICKKCNRLEYIYLEIFLGGKKSGDSTHTSLETWLLWLTVWKTNSVANSITNSKARCSLKSRLGPCSIPENVRQCHDSQVLSQDRSEQKCQMSLWAQAFRDWVLLSCFAQSADNSLNHLTQNAADSLHPFAANVHLGDYAGLPWYLEEATTEPAVHLRQLRTIVHFSLCCV